MTTPPPLPGAASGPAGPPPLPEQAAPAAAPPAAAPPAAAPTAAGLLHTSCPSCGSQIAYAPGTTSLRCSSCGFTQQIDAPERAIVEHSYDAWAALPPKPVATIGEQVLTCSNCGATTETDDLSGTCQFCSGVLVALANPDGLIAPEAVVPFRVDKSGANSSFTTWVRSRRFAPGALKRVGSTETLAGTYVPHWTYDSQTQTDYDGQRGEYYYVTETYTVSDGDGGTRTETRQVRHTRWYPASGTVARAFDDVLVPASGRVDPERLTKMGPWTLGDATAYQPQYLAGYSALRYDVDPDTGLQTAKQMMEQVVAEDVRQDIGGDEQRIGHMDIRYSAMMFKLMLLPLWIASYVYAGKTYQVLVNANTGQVVGERPYSKLKIALTVLAALVVIAAIVVAVVLAKHK